VTGLPEKSIFRSVTVYYKNLSSQYNLTTQNENKCRIEVLLNTTLSSWSQISRILEVTI